MPHSALKRLLCGATTAALLAGPAAALIVRDDVGIEGSIDTANQWGAVVQIFLQNNITGAVSFNCTGTLINARTVITASHCLNGASSEQYGAAADGMPYTVLIGFGADTQPRALHYLDTGDGYHQGGLAQASQVLIHPSGNIDTPGRLDFPYGDVTMLALDAPVHDVAPMAMMLSPLQTLTHVVQAGYGTFGVGTEGEQGIGFRRLVGENMLGMIGSNADYIDGVFPAFAPSGAEYDVPTQTMYWTDFDNPHRTAQQQAECTYTGEEIVCDSVESVFAIDYLTDDAQAREAATAAGDSGGPMIADRLTGRPLLLGVLSGGYNIFELGSTYSDTSFYNPLFAFQRFIVENNPMKFVTAQGGDGDWFDPAHWVQTLDPGYFIYDASGAIVNGVPGGAESGVFTTGPKIGSVLGVSIAGQPREPSAEVPDPGTPGFGDNLPIASVLLGPGSTGFVPNNTNGARGVPFTRPALYFDVTLAAAGRTTTAGGTFVEIDRLTLAHQAAGLQIGNGVNFRSLIDVRLTAGELAVDGRLTTSDLLAFGGLVSGHGLIALTSGGDFVASPSTAMVLGAAGLAPGRLGEVGTLTVAGNVQLSSGSALFVELGAGGGDLLRVTGGGALDANNALLSVGLVGEFAPRYGQSFRVIETEDGLLSGGFNTADTLPGVLRFAYARDLSPAAFDYGVLTVAAAPFATAATYTSDAQREIARGLDAIRTRSGGYAALNDIYAEIDPLNEALLPVVFDSLAPLSGFAAAGVAEARHDLVRQTIADRRIERVSGDGDGFRIVSDDRGGGTAALANRWGGFIDIRTMVSSRYALSDTRAAALEATAVSLGLDYRFDSGAFAGGMVSYATADAGRDGSMPSADGAGVAITAYGGARSGSAVVTAYAGYDAQDVDVTRVAVLPSGAQSLTASSDAEGWTAGARLGVEIDAGRGALTPYVAVDGRWTAIDGYTEAGGTAALAVEARRLDDIDARIGVAYAADFDIGDARLRPRIDIAFVADADGADAPLVAAFPAFASEAFVFAPAGGEDYVAYRVGLDYDSDSIDVSLSYAGADDGRMDSQSIAGRVSVAF